MSSSWVQRWQPWQHWQCSCDEGAAEERVRPHRGALLARCTVAVARMHQATSRDCIVCPGCRFSPWLQVQSLAAGSVPACSITSLLQGALQCHAVIAGMLCEWLMQGSSPSAAGHAHLFQCRLSHHMCSQLSVTGRGPPPICMARIISSAARLAVACKYTVAQRNGRLGLDTDGILRSYRHMRITKRPYCPASSHGSSILTSHIRGTCPRIASRLIPASLQHEAT